ncbi:MAG: hypothetical protein ABII12_12745 [Planctomycetota bacterium]
MADEKAIEILNRLLDAEYTSLAQRIGEVYPFVEGSKVAVKTVVERMVAAETDNQLQLAKMIVRLRGAPVTPRRTTATTGMHYLDLSFLIPKMVAAQKKLIRLYETTGATGNADADALIGRIQAGHQSRLAELESLVQTPTK